MKKELINLSLGLSILAILLSGYAILNKGITTEEFDQLAENYPQRMQDKESAKKSEGAENIALINSKDQVLGNKDADITIFEYSDFECPFCKRFSNTPSTVVSNSNGKVNTVYRHFPIKGELSTKQALAAECSSDFGGNEMFFKYKKEIYETTKSGGNGMKEEQFFTIAKNLGINTVEFKKCYDSRKYEDKIKADFDSGVAAGINGTPGVIIRNNKTKEVAVMPGAVDVEFIEKAIIELSK